MRIRETIRNVLFLRGLLEPSLSTEALVPKSST